VSQPAQVNLPPEPQLLLLVLAVADEEAKNDAGAEIILKVSSPSQSGQCGTISDSENRTTFSKELPQSLQWNSYRGI
jgi:hypothetical protein